MKENRDGNPKHRCATCKKESRTCKLERSTHSGFNEWFCSKCLPLDAPTIEKKSHPWPCEPCSKTVGLLTATINERDKWKASAMVYAAIAIVSLAVHVLHYLKVL